MAHILAIVGLPFFTIGAVLRFIYYMMMAGWETMSVYLNKVYR